MKEVKNPSASIARACSGGCCRSPSSSSTSSISTNVPRPRPRNRNKSNRCPTHAVVFLVASKYDMTHRCAAGYCNKYIRNSSRLSRGGWGCACVCARVRISVFCVSARSAWMLTKNCVIERLAMNRCLLVCVRVCVCVNEYGAPLYPLIFPSLHFLSVSNMT